VIGSGSRVTVVDGGLLGTKAGFLVRFDAVFGDGPGQIPYGSQITSVSLTLSSRGDGSATATAGVYRMLADWSPASSWASMLTSGLGIQRDNVEAAAAADASVVNLANGTHVFTGFRHGRRGAVVGKGSEPGLGAVAVVEQTPGRFTPTCRTTGPARR
jgi:hypothetical protein